MMDAKRLTGANAGSLKYDLLTALAVFGLHGTPRDHLATSRLIAVVTARYNWRLDEFCVGQRDLAKMWNVTERTVKREIKHWITTGLVICKRQGVRGRVGAYRLNYAAIFRLTESAWPYVGPDFQDRMSGNAPVQHAAVVKVDFAAKTRVTHTEDPEWAAFCSHVQDQAPGAYSSWISQLTFVDKDTRAVTVHAPSKFVAQYVATNLSRLLDDACTAAFGRGRRIVVTSPE